MNKNRLTILIFTSFLFACSPKSDFEKFAYEMCVKEGKYPDMICACNAKNLDSSLSNDEKTIYKKAALGDMSSSFTLLQYIDKFQNALQKCAN